MDGKAGETDITLLVSVVDNYGDIGFAWRLAKDILRHSDIIEKTGKKLSLRMCVDSLSSFALLNPAVRPLPVQKISTENGSLTLFDSTAKDECYSFFLHRPPRFILELFQCGRPDWMERLLFDEKKSEETLIIMIDYLSAEPYTRRFHLLSSITRSTRVKKINFMPGFFADTGGLIIDRRAVSEKRSASSFRVLFFSYPTDFAIVIRALSGFNRKTRGKLSLFLARGVSFALFLAAYEEYKERNGGEEPFCLTKLSFLSQEEWDEMTDSMDMLFIRGEESLSRAVLSGKPFIHHAYRQSEEYHLVKTAALLDVMKSDFPPPLFAVLQRAWMSYNKDEELHGKMEAALGEFFVHYEEIKPCFAAFAARIRSNGNLSEKLLSFILESEHFPLV